MARWHGHRRSCFAEGVPPPTSGRSRLGLGAAALALALALGASGVLPAAPTGASGPEATGPSALPSVALPAAEVPASTWRGQAEAWVKARLFPAVLGRIGTGHDGTTWGQRAITDSPAQVALLIATTPEARARMAGWAYQQGLQRTASAADKQWWAERMGSGGWTYDQVLAHLLASPEHTASYPADRAWLTFLYREILGRSPDAGGLAQWEGVLRRPVARHVVARQFLSAPESRDVVTTFTYSDALGRAPTAAERTRARAVLTAFRGDQQRLRAEIATLLGPSGYRVGVAGDSVAFDLERQSRGQPLPAVVTGGGQRPVGAARMACSVLSTRAGYRYPVRPDLALTDPRGGWGLPSDGKCPDEVPHLDRAMLDARPHVVIWPIGAWEWTPVRRPDGVVVPARSAALRGELATEMVRRIDTWRARGVTKVVLPEWACVGTRSMAEVRTTEYVTFIRSVLDEVAARRPGVAVVAATPPAVCAGGVPTGAMTPAHRTARGDQFHWAAGRGGAAWGWRAWFAPAVADLVGVG